MRGRREEGVSDTIFGVKVHMRKGYIGTEGLAVQDKPGEVGAAPWNPLSL